MKRRYIASLVVFAVLAAAYVAYVVYSYRAVILEIFKKKVFTKLAFTEIKPGPVRTIQPEDLLARTEGDPALLQDLATLNAALATAVSKSTDIAYTTESIVKNESAQKKQQSVPIAGVITEATKYRKIGDEKKASKKYDGVLRKIVEEKAKSAVLLTAIRNEQLKAEKLKIMQSLDMENSPLYGMRIRPVTKKDCENFIRLTAIA
jgi:hypothetical protein